MIMKEPLPKTKITPVVPQLKKTDKIQGCMVKPQKKLPNHLTVAHPTLTMKERKLFLTSAVIVKSPKKDAAAQGQW